MPKTIRFATFTMVRGAKVYRLMKDHRAHTIPCMTNNKALPKNRYYISAEKGGEIGERNERHSAKA